MTKRLRKARRVGELQLAAGAVCAGTIGMVCLLFWSVQGA
jgi:hypothetical protein